MRSIYDLDEPDLGTAIGLVISIIFIAVLMVILLISATFHDSKWNDGHCECGGNWVYDQPVGHQYSTNYLYECDKCGRVYEFYEKR